MAHDCDHYPELWWLGFLTPYSLWELIEDNTVVTVDLWTEIYFKILYHTHTSCTGQSIIISLTHEHHINMLYKVGLAKGGYKAQMSFSMSCSYPHIWWPSPDPMTPDPNLRSHSWSGERDGGPSGGRKPTGRVHLPVLKAGQGSVEERWAAIAAWWPKGGSGAGLERGSLVH